MAAHDVHSFVQKFLNLCNEGKTAHLNLECCAGKAFVNLRLDLAVSPPQSYAPQHPPPPRLIACDALRHVEEDLCDVLKLERIQIEIIPTLQQLNK